MTPDRLFRGMGGLFILLSAVLTYFVSIWFVLLTGFIGFMLFQSSLTNVCPGMVVARKMLGK